ncbi:preprotein translocase subunit SecE [Anaeroselena agilis]|uniref:Protein translocase subunit SecE n=1 Tax=Anaeroselena agilis TaxID=3063788 RepID=A0ABU3P0Z3_9FIRM|nr:preprotein translocase subunit SecE [Selenomonadales bacterium 4137-cl]
MTAQETAIKTRTSGMKRYLREVRAELKKVSWPDKKELSAYTGVVFISVIVAALVIWLMDTGFAETLKLLLRR